MQIGFRGVVGLEHDGFAIGSPVHGYGGAQFASAHTPLAAGNLARCATIGRDNEQMRMPVL